MSYERKLRKTVVLEQHDEFDLKLMIQYEQNNAYFCVEYGGHIISGLSESIGNTQRLYKNILRVLKLEREERVKE